MSFRFGELRFERAFEKIEEHCAGSPFAGMDDKVVFQPPQTFGPWRRGSWLGTDAARGENELIVQYTESVISLLSDS